MSFGGFQTQHLAGLTCVFTDPHTDRFLHTGCWWVQRLKSIARSDFRVIFHACNSSAQSNTCSEKTFHFLLWENKLNRHRYLRPCVSGFQMWSDPTPAPREVSRRPLLELELLTLV